MKLHGIGNVLQEVHPNFTARAAVLTDLLRGPLPDRVNWTDECEAAFKDLKTALAYKPVLTPPNYDKLFTLYTDASDRGLEQSSLKRQMMVNTPFTIPPESCYHEKDDIR